MPAIDILRASLLLAVLLAGWGRLRGASLASARFFPILSSGVFAFFYLNNLRASPAALQTDLILNGASLAAVFWLGRLASSSGTPQHWRRVVAVLGLFAVLLGPELLRRSAGVPLTRTLGLSYLLFRLFDAVASQSRQSAPTRILLQTTAFPTLPVGPIVLHRQFGVIKRPFQISDVFYRRAVLLILIGAIKLFLLLPWVDAHWETGVRRPIGLSLPSLVNVAQTGAYYYVRLFLDFSGYSDLAVGICALLGLRIRHNFRQPYLALSLRDFWRRWHITLASFIQRHVYIPLGGGRGSAWQRTRNLGAAFILLGAWHGLTPAFLAWGGLHALGLAAEHAVRERWLLRSSTIGARALRYVLTQSFILFSWVVFFWK
ncbi:MAG: hypothetical protein KDK39_06805 [Leptospiraceae bacterium]|nr:hypothetical protein [Leptospiraceae bacterium]